MDNPVAVMEQRDLEFERELSLNDLEKAINEISELNSGGGVPLNTKPLTVLPLSEDLIPPEMQPIPAAV